MKKTKLAITLPEYEKIFRIIHGVSTYVNNGNPPSCLLFNIIGALILKKVYRIEANPRVGAAFVMIYDQTKNTLAFANMNFDKCFSNIDAFHCWIETPDFYIDFTSPVYGDYLGASLVPRYMFQKPKHLMSFSHLELESAGDFYFAPNSELTEERVNFSLNSTKFQDFSNISLYWARLSKKSLLERMHIHAVDGENVILKASPITLLGAW